MTSEGATENPFYQELLRVHSMIRRDLETVSELARAVAGGEDAAVIRERLAELKAGGPLWQLKVNCLHYCRFVHTHHRVEDIAVFPALRRGEPELEPVLDRLEAEHRRVSTLLERVEAACDASVGDDALARREELVAALAELSDLLLAHLAFEEERLEGPLGRMRSWAG